MENLKHLVFIDIYDNYHSLVLPSLLANHTIRLSHFSWKVDESTHITKERQKALRELAGSSFLESVQQLELPLPAKPRVEKFTWDLDFDKESFRALLKGIQRGKMECLLFFCPTTLRRFSKNENPGYREFRQEFEEAVFSSPIGSCVTSIRAIDNAGSQETFMGHRARAPLQYLEIRLDQRKPKGPLPTSHFINRRVRVEVPGPFTLYSYVGDIYPSHFIKNGAELEAFLWEKIRSENLAPTYAVNKDYVQPSPETHQLIIANELDERNCRPLSLYTSKEFNKLKSTEGGRIWVRFIKREQGLLRPRTGGSILSHEKAPGVWGAIGRGAKVVWDLVTKTKKPQLPPPKSSPPSSSSSSSSSSSKKPA